MWPFKKREKVDHSISEAALQRAEEAAERARRITGASARTGAQLRREREINHLGAAVADALSQRKD